MGEEPDDYLRVELSIGMLDNAMKSDFLSTVNVNSAFRAGSSKHGKALRALVATKIVDTKYLKKSTIPPLLAVETAYFYGKIALLPHCPYTSKYSFFPLKTSYPPSFLKKKKKKRERERKSLCRTSYQLPLIISRLLAVETVYYYAGTALLRYCLYIPKYSCSFPSKLPTPLHF